MTHHRTLANNFRSALMSLIVGAIAVLLPKVFVFAEPQPGELLEVNIQTPNGPVALRFRYCPPGQMMRGRPQPLPEATGNALLDQIKRKALLAELKGFYMGETEVSQQQLERILGQMTVDDIFKRMVAGEAGGRGNEFPIRGVTVVEAAKFCESLRDFDGQNQAGELSLEARKFRLPTHDEWQYACRAIRDVEQTLKLPHFNVWPELKHVPMDVVADCQDVWTKKLGEQIPFDGSQEQVVRVIEAHDTSKRGVEILSAFLQLALGTKRNYADAETQPQPVVSGTKNAWNLFNMHGNVFEWTIAESDHDRADQIWEMLATENAGALAENSSKVFFLAGGSYNSALAQKVSDWMTFSIWGGQPMNEGGAAALSFTELEDQNVVQDTPPGFRVLLERVLAKDWLLVIREATILNDKDTLDAIRQRLADHRKAVAELSTGNDYAIAEARINFYEAIETYRKGNKSECAKLLDATGSSLAKEDSFFAHFQELAQADAQ